MAETIGHYETLAVAGTGATGPVYRARDTRVGRTVAIRVLDQEVADPWQRAHFLENVRPYTALSHPHIATLFEAGEQGGRLHLVYEFVPGERLASLVAGHPLNLRRALDLAIQTADALAEAHVSGLPHGALGPASVIVTPKGHAKIIDFGLSFWRHADRADPFLSPEQAGGAAGDHRSDIYSLGAMLFLLLTGRPPSTEIRDSAGPGLPGRETPPPPSRRNLEVPASLDRIVRKAMAKDPEHRYADASVLAADLRAAAAEVHARDAEFLTEQQKPRSRFRSGLRLAALVALLAAAAAAAVFQWREPLHQAWQSYFGQSLEPVLIVVPFEVADADAARAHLGPGLAEELASLLGHTPGVRVLGRSSMRGFAGRDPRAIAEEHRASLAVTARLAARDDTWEVLELRVTLISRSTGEGVWNRRYDIEARDLLSAQAKIAQDIASRLAVPFEPTPALRRASLRLVRPTALDAYLQARTAMAELDTNRAVRLFGAALEADPGLIEAQAGLAESLYASAVFEHRLGYQEVEARLQRAAAEAITTDPDLAHAQLAMALASPTLSEALEHIRRALEIDPSDTAIYVAGAALIRDVDPASALRLLGWARALDPGQPRVRFEAAAANLVLEQPDQTLVEAARGQALVPSLPWWDALRLRVRLSSAAASAASVPEQGRSLPGFPPGALVRAQVLAGAGEREAAAAAIGTVVRLFPGFCEARATQAGLFRETDRAEAARQAAAIYRIAESAPGPLARCAAMAAAATGDPRQAAAWMTRAAASEEGILGWVRSNGVLSAQAGLRQKVYPWALVLGSPDVTRAAGRLNDALTNARAQVARALGDLEDPVSR